MYCLHFNLWVYKKYFIILIQGDIKHFSFLNERSPVEGEEHSKSVYPLRGRAVTKMGPRFQAARGMGRWG